jgi:hypothetical protein
MEDDFFHAISRHFWMEFPHPRVFQKHNPQPRFAPHEFDHDIPYPSLTARFSWQRRFFNRQKQRVMLLTTLSAGAIIHSMLLTKFAVTRRYQVRPGVFKKNISTQQSTWIWRWKMAAAWRWHWKMVAVWWHWEMALGGGLRLQLWRWAVVAAEEHATMVLTSALLKQRGNCYDVGISISKDGKRGCVRCNRRTSMVIARR